jgi:aminopeptidase N
VTRLHPRQGVEVLRVSCADNINGSQVTGQSPFEIWLNEAVTVHIQRQREDELFGADFMRLRTVLYAFKPATGPLAEDASPIAMPVEPYGFNRTQELISSMTYSKAPEFVRMVELMIGKPAFNRGLHEYHSKYAFGNATTWDWVACMEAASGIPLKDMATGWLKRSGEGKGYKPC